MTSIEKILQQAINPFDSVNFRPGNFWQESQHGKLTVHSIHQTEIEKITETLDLVNGDRRTRTILLCGDSGAGKSHLLDRLKQTLNRRAFFAYIGPWVDRNFLWRHILRNTVDSLLKVPPGQQESQLLIWLKSLSIFKEHRFLDKLLGDRKVFIRKLRESYTADLYNANEFLGVLYDLLDGEKFLLASDWLRGENLDDDDLTRLRVRHPIETEDAAQKILANFGQISIDTFPIVLCFDNLDCIAGTTDGETNLQYLLNFNSTLHNEKFKNFLIIFSLITHTAHKYVNRMQPSDLARVDRQVLLKPITLNQAEFLYKTRLSSLHKRANPKPKSPIFPLERAILETSFPGGKTNPRNALEVARKLVLEYKTGRSIISEDAIAAFRLVWLNAFDRTQKQVTRVRQFSSLELVQMLKQAILALQINDLNQRSLFLDRYTSSTLSYNCGDRKVGVVWIEEPNLNYFFYVMKSCQEILDRDLYDRLILIRAEKLGQAKNKGYQLYQRIFTKHPHIHIISTLKSVCYLATYQTLYRASFAGELVVGNQTLDVERLENLIRESQVWQDFPLLQDLGLIKSNPRELNILDSAREFLINLVKTQQLIGRNTLIENAIDRFPQIDRLDLNLLLDRMCENNQIQILDPNASQDEQLICIMSS
ncbi:ATP-binding protein [Oscillatoriales cyanobacterium LEGE 11467]|uniref:ATP-binding protein n=1 Tax=Zarconia navalis LEGE 11467 TaxID=1828826 RepID=A0A928Z7V8_9CYAN|nr:ATP-binding protein [Zarconia navalis]MBE9041827.1 ATP-binding protein [Zarconia navalis LEGE 11467]